jgi:Subtilase family
VAFAEPDWIRWVDACDPDVCWHLAPKPGANVLQAHQGGATGAGQTVAVVDTGVASGVGDLDGQVGARLRCTGGGCGLAVAAPTSSHGTEVASVIAAADDSDGTTGVAPGATIVSYRVDATGGGIPISYLRAALDHIAANDDIDVVNLSLGGSQWSELERAGIDAVLSQGKVVVASAGNTGDRVPQYPAAFRA